MSSPSHKKQRKQKSKNDKRRNGAAKAATANTSAKIESLNEPEPALNGSATTARSNNHVAFTDGRDSYAYNSHACTLASPDDEAEMARVYERLRIRALAEEREKVQKKTFTKWINMQLEKGKVNNLIEDLYHDLRDGRSLLKLLELLTGDAVSKPGKGRMRIHCLENVDKVLGLLRDAYDVHLENLGAHDIVDGNARLTLGLIWTLILRFQIQGVRAAEEPDGETCVASVAEPVYAAPPAQQKQALPRSASSAAREATEALLLWCQMKTAGYRNVNVRNFKTSWRDGLAFSALIHKHRPDLIEFHALHKTDARDNLENAFAVAEERLNIARLLDPEDVDCETPDERSIITYVVTLYHYFSKTRTDTLGVRRAQRMLTDLASIDKQALELDLQTDDLLKWIKATCAKLDERVFEATLAGVRSQLQSFGSYRKEQKPSRFAHKGTIEAQYATLRSRLQLSKAQLSTPNVVALRVKLQDLDTAWTRLEHAEHDRETALRDELSRLERLEQLAANFDRKASMREQWLIENLQLVSQNPLASDYASVLANSKKHEAISEDICLYLPRIGALEKIVADLRKGHYYDLQRIEDRMRKVKKFWDDLADALKLRGDKLQLCCRVQLLAYTMGELRAQIDALQQRVTGDLGKSVAGVDLLLERNALLHNETDSLAHSVVTCRDEVDAEILSGHLYDMHVPSARGSDTPYVPYPPETFSKLVIELEDALERLRWSLSERADALQASKSRWVFVELVNDEMRLLLDEVELVFQETHIAVRHACELGMLTQLAKRAEDLDASVERKRRRAAELASRGAPLIDDEAVQNGAPDVRAHMDTYRARVEALRVEIVALREECSEKLRLSQFLEDTHDLLDELASLNRLADDRLLLSDRADVPSSRNALAAVRADVEPLARRFDQLCAVDRAQLAEHDRSSPLVLEQLAAVRQRLAVLDDTLLRWQAVLADRQRFALASDQLDSLLMAISRRETTQKLVESDVIAFDEGTSFDELAFYLAKLDQLTSAVAALRNDALPSLDRIVDSMRADGSSFTAQCAAGRDTAAQRLTALDRDAVTRRTQLVSLFDVAQLAEDLQESTAWLSERLRIVTETEKQYSGVNDLAGLLRQQRALSGVERDLKTVEERVLKLATRVDALEPRCDASAAAPLVSAELRESLLKRFANVNVLWDQLLAAMRQRDDRLKDSRELQHFLVDVEDYCAWLERTRTVCEEDCLPNSIEAVEASLQQHETLKHDIASHRARFTDELYPLGLRVAKEGAATHSDNDSEYVRLLERVESLKYDSDQLNDRWSDKQRSLSKRLALLLFAKDCKQIEAALGRADYQLLRLQQRRPVAAVECRELLKQLDTLVLTTLQPLDTRRELLRAGADKLRADWRPALTADEHERIEQKLSFFADRRHAQTDAAHRLRDSLQRTLRFLSLLEQCADLEDLFIEKHSAAHRVATDNEEPSEAEIRKHLARLRVIESELLSNEPQLAQVAADVQRFVNELRSEPIAPPAPAPVASAAPEPEPESKPKDEPVAHGKKNKKARKKAKKHRQRTDEPQTPEHAAAAAATGSPTSSIPSAPSSPVVEAGAPSSATLASELEERLGAARHALELALSECRSREAAVVEANRGALCDASLRQTENWIESLQTQMIASMPLSADTVEAVCAPFSAQLLVPPRHGRSAETADSDSRTSVNAEELLAARSANRAYAEVSRLPGTDTASVHTSSVGRSSTGVSQRHLEKLIRQQENVELQLRVKLGEVEQFERQTLLLSQSQPQMHTESHVTKELLTKQTEQRRQLDALGEQLRENRDRLEILKQLKRFSIALDVERGWLEDHEAVMRSLVARFAEEPNQLVHTNARAAHLRAELLAKRLASLQREVDAHRAFVDQLAESVRLFRAENEQSAGETLRPDLEDLTERASVMCSAHGAFQQRIADTMAHRVQLWRAYFLYLADLFDVRVSLDEKRTLVDGIPSAPNFSECDSAPVTQTKTETLLSGAPVEPRLPDCDSADSRSLVPFEPTLSLRRLAARRRTFERDMKRLDELEAELNILHHERLQDELNERRELLMRNIVQLTEMHNDSTIVVDSSLPSGCFSDTLGDVQRVIGLIESKRALLNEALRHANNECSLLELIEWLYEHIAITAVNANASSLEHAHCLLDKFDLFRDETLAHANHHVPIKLDDCRRLLAEAELQDVPNVATPSDSDKGNDEKSVTAESVGLAAKALYAAYIDLLNELHSDLVELLATKRYHLETQIDKFAFITQCVALFETITCKLDEVAQLTVCESAPADADMDSFVHEHRERIHRSSSQLACLEAEVRVIGEQVEVASAHYRRLVPAYGGTPLLELTHEHEKLIIEWRKLRLMLDSNLKSAGGLGKLATFLQLAALFTSWCDRMRTEMLNRQNAITTISDVQGAYSDHVSRVKHYIDAHNQSYRSCLDIGFELVRAGHEQSELVKNRMIDVADHCFEVRDFWELERARLSLLVDVCSFMENATSAAEWLSAHEAIIGGPDLTDTLAEIERLLKAHDIVEKTLSRERERFERVKDLTQLEISGGKSSDVVEAERLDRRERFIHTDVFSVLDSVEREQARASGSSMPLEVDVVHRSAARDEAAPSGGSKQASEASSSSCSAEAQSRPVSIELVAPRTVTPALPTPELLKTWSGAVIRKHLTEAGIRRAPDRAWHAVYCVIEPQTCTLSFHKDAKQSVARLTKAATVSYFRNEPPVSLRRAIAQQTEYKKRRFVLSVTLETGASYLFQCTTEQETGELVRRLNAIAVSHLHASSALQTAIDQGTELDAMQASQVERSATVPRAPADSGSGAPVGRRWTFLTLRRKKDKNTQRPVSLQEGANVEA